MSGNLHRVIFGDLVLSDGTTERPMDTDYWFSVMGENFSTGAPEPITRTIETFMLDGAMVIREGDGNRTMTVFVGIHGPDTQVLTDGEVALALETGKRNQFIYEEFDGFGPPTLFEVVTSSFGQVPDDLREVMQCERVYALSIIALPQAFSVDVTRTPALESAASAPVVISDGTSAAGWTSPYGTVTSTSGYLVVPRGDWSYAFSGSTYDAYAAPVEMTLTFASPVDFTATLYLQFEYGFTESNPGFDGLEVEVDGSNLPRVDKANVPTGPMSSRVTYLTSDSSATTVKISATLLTYVPTGAAPGVADFIVDNVQRSAAAPSTGTTRQKQRTLELAGSVRTPGTLIVSHPTSALGDVLVHTCPDFGTGYTAPILQFATSPSTADASTPSGRIFTLGSSGATIDVPTSTLMPGSYVLMGRFRHSNAGNATISWSARTRINATDVGAVLSGSHTMGYAAGAWVNVTLGILDLPASRVGRGSSSVQRLVVTASSLDMGGLWLFFVGDQLGNRGQLSQASCGTGTPASGGDSNMLFINSATIDEPLPGVFVGTKPDQSDARFAAGAMWEQHEFVPGGMIVTTITTNALDAGTALESRAAGHSHAPSP